MNDEELDDAAAEFALGTLDASGRRQMAIDMLADPALARDIADWERRFALLAESTPPVAPPARLWERIADGITRPSPAKPSAVTVYGEEGRWRRVAPGIEAKLLFVDPESGARSALLRCEPGASIRPHTHLLVEECLMLRGDLTFGSLTLQAGDYHAIPGGAIHPPGHTRDGCLLFIRGDLEMKAA